MSESFHAHLDICPRCKESPFNLGPTGNLLLRGFAVPPEVAQKPCKALGDTTDELFDSLGLGQAAGVVAPELSVEHLKDVFRKVFSPESASEALKNFRP